MELILVTILALVSIVISGIAIGFSIYNYVQFRIFTSSTQAIPVSDVNDIANSLFSDSVSNEDIKAMKKMATNLSAEDLV